MNQEPEIRITEEDLKEPEIQISAEETLYEPRPARIIIKEDVIAYLNASTKEYNLQGRGEFWVFLLGRGQEVEKYVGVGTGYQHGVIASPEEVIEKLRPHTERGYKVLADYHNHPHTSVADYQIAGYPAAYATSPSIPSDFDSPIRKAVLDELHQLPYPRIISAYSEEDGGVLMNAFNVLRQPTREEESTVLFEEPIVIHEVPDATGITMLPSKYSNPKKLIEKGIIEPINIQASLNNGGTMEIPNFLQLALE